MNKLIFPNGGVYVEGDDFIFLQESFLEGLRALASIFFPEGYGILSGCEIQGGTSVLPGFVLVDHEIYFAAPTTITPGGASLYWAKPIETYPVSGVEPLKDGGTANTYAVRTAQWAIAAPPLVRVLLVGERALDTVYNYLEPKFNEKADVAQGNYTLRSYADLGLGSSTLPAVRFMLDTVGTVFIHANYVVPTTGTASAILPTGLPTNLRPLVDLPFTVTVKDGATVYSIIAVLNANDGHINLFNLLPNSAQVNFNLTFKAQL